MNCGRVLAFFDNRFFLCTLPEGHEGKCGCQLDRFRGFNFDQIHWFGPKEQTV